ncbi:Glucose-1-phosphate thymidylyltransferase [Lunatimonas lonarensis]|uniref:Glucose-1-phosphate thymidylyltransferase n=1 Tax=Lunatimonas lonarensis TaxID=1232681 RepID=R7ZNC9_9BACT|nr:putative sugar nucleotidyl transferase [Lunatimonas lonarensis]EON75578.1 Glucose-1-phosphate thymidylyltransferase [Lunatimonas lonarensis]
MDYFILFDDPKLRENLLPLTFTRPIADLRIGILKIKEKWEAYLSHKTGVLTAPYLQQKFPYNNQPAWMINSAVFPDARLAERILALDKTESLWQNDTLIAFYSQDPKNCSFEKSSFKIGLTVDSPVVVLKNLWNLFQFNGDQIRADFTLLTRRRISSGCSDAYTHIYKESNVFIEPGASIRASIINAENGPVYIGKNVQILEGNLIRGPFAICEESVLSMGSKMRGDITIGPKCKVGGEVSNSVFQGYSNKSHDGYLGNSVVGEWCNLGANTNTSNMKNNHSSIRVWSYPKENFVDSGLQFCGSFIGDHAKLAISTMLNSGTVVGVGANLFGEGFPKKLVPSFAWGGPTGFSSFELKKFEDAASRAMALKGESFLEVDRSILQHVFELTRSFRIWDKDF